MFTFADYEEISSENVIIAKSDEAYSLNLTIYNDADFSEPNETIVIAMSVDFLTTLDDAETASLQSRIFLDPPTTTITIVNSGKIYNNNIFSIVNHIVAYSKHIYIPLSIILVHVCVFCCCLLLLRSR